MSTQQTWLILAGVVLAGVLLYLLSPVLMPFVLGAILAYIANPLVKHIEAWHLGGRHLSRTLAVSLVFVILSMVLLAMLLVLVPLIETQLRVLLGKTPGYIDWLQSQGLPWLAGQLGMSDSGFDLGALKEAVQQHWQQASGLMTGVVASISRSGLALVGWVASLLLTVVVTFYLLRDWDTLLERIHALLPRRSEPVISQLAHQADEMLGAFLRGQLLVMLALGFIYSVGLSLLGLDFALLIGTLAGLVSFVPYLGFIVGILIASIAVLLQFQDPIYLLYVLLVFGVGQTVESALLTPLLVGDRIGLHPVAVIFAVLAGGQLFGFIGVLLALPVAALVMVLLRYAHDRYRDSHLYKDQPRDVDQA